MTLRRAGWRRSSATLQSQLLHHLLQIVPDLPLLLRRTEEVSRVEGRHDGNAFVLAPVAAQAGDGGLVPEQGLGGELPQGDDGLGLDGRELPFEERFAGGELVLLRIAIVGRPAGARRRPSDRLAPRPRKARRAARSTPPLRKPYRPTAPGRLRMLRAFALRPSRAKPVPPGRKVNTVSPSGPGPAPRMRRWRNRPSRPSSPSGSGPRPRSAVR